MRAIIPLCMALSIYLFSSCSGTNASTSATYSEAPSQDSISISLDSIIDVLQMQDAVIVDVRKLDQYNEGHIPNSVHIPLDSVEMSLDQFRQYSNIVLVCNTGNTAGKAKKILNDNGFNNVYNGRGWAQLNDSLK